MMSRLMRLEYPILGEILIIILICILSATVVGIGLDLIWHCGAWIFSWTRIVLDVIVGFVVLVLQSNVE